VANINAAAIITRVRELVDDASGTLRTISSSRFGESFYLEMKEEEQARKAVSGPKFDVRLTTIERHPSSPPISGSTALYNVTVEVTVIRHLNVNHAVIDANRDTILAASIEDGDHIMQALTYPGNMTQTSAAVATGLASGVLQYAGSENEVLLGAASEPSLVRGVHRFTGVAVVTLATS
jgi:hypothetical protein